MPITIYPSKPMTQRALVLLLLCSACSSSAAPVQPAITPLLASRMTRLAEQCHGGDLAGCDTLGMYHWARDLESARDSAVGIWDAACRQDGVGACASLALAYDNDSWAGHNQKRAFVMLQDACARGSQPACVGVAARLTDGRGGTKDGKRGTSMMMEACEKNDMYACNNLGYRFYDGTYGERKNSRRAQEMFARACAVAVPAHPYPWYRDTARDSCRLAKELS